MKEKLYRNSLVWCRDIDFEATRVREANLSTAARYTALLSGIKAPAATSTWIKQSRVVEDSEAKAAVINGRCSIGSQRRPSGQSSCRPD